MTDIDTAALAKRRYRLGLRMFTDSVRWLRVWLVAALVLAFTGTPAITLIWGETGTSVWTVVISVLQWFAAVTAGVWLHTQMPKLIANGITRREATVAFVVFGGLTTLGLTALATAGFAVEHTMLALVAEPLGTWGEVAADGARYLLIAPVYFFSGAAVVAVTLRIGKEGTFVTILVLLVPALFLTGALSFEMFGHTLDTDTWAVMVWAGTGFAFTAVLVAVVALALRSLPIQGKQA